jgi:hypothetical protein
MSAYINILQHPDSLPHEVTPIQKLELQSEDYMEKGVEEKTLFDLKEVDPYTEKVQAKHISSTYFPICTCVRLITQYYNIDKNTRNMFSFSSQQTF